VSTWKPATPPGDDLPRRLTGSLDRLARRIGAPSAGALGTVFGKWEEVVGTAVAAHARPVALRRGHLVVAVDEPGWATQVRFLSADLLKRLADELGEGLVTTVDVRVEGPRKGRGNAPENGPERHS
jgi:predicted nucleic acid-binding Zn ribbon protein